MTLLRPLAWFGEEPSKKTVKIMTKAGYYPAVKETDSLSAFIQRIKDWNQNNPHKPIEACAGVLEPRHLAALRQWAIAGSGEGTIPFYMMDTKEKTFVAVADIPI